MDFVYMPGLPSGRHEQELAREYRWVRTNSIEATRVGEPFDPQSADRLGTHSHHGENTHLMVTGDLDIKVQGGARRGKHVRISADDVNDINRGRFRGWGSDRRRRGGVPPNVPYSGTSRRGCSFVEGHRTLSPATAERFLDRGTLRAVVRQDVSNFWRLRQEFPSDEILKQYLRNVDFDPAGKADPDYSRGEKAILEPRPGCPAIAHSAKRAIASWFENEWRNEKKKKKAVSMTVMTVIAVGLPGILLAIVWLAYFRI